jgi:uncharacterized protein YidB (DUF937 family)
VLRYRCHLKSKLRQPEKREITMGLFDSIANAAKGAMGQAEAAALPGMLNQMMGGGDQGGLSAITSKLEQAGLGDQVKSWIGSGPNLPVSADQIRDVLGNDQVKALASKFGIPIDDLAKMVADKLPGLVDSASPDGQLAPTA